MRTTKGFQRRARLKVGPILVVRAAAMVLADLLATEQVVDRADHSPCIEMRVP